MRDTLRIFVTATRGVPHISSSFRSSDLTIEQVEEEFDRIIQSLTAEREAMRKCPAHRRVMLQAEWKS